MMKRGINAVKIFVMKMYTKLSIMTDLHVDFFKYLKENNLWKVPLTKKPLEPKHAQVKKESCKFG